MEGEANLPAAALTVEELPILPLLFCLIGPEAPGFVLSGSTRCSLALDHSISSARATTCWSMRLRLDMTARACSRCICSAIFRRAFSASRLIRSASFFLNFSSSRLSCSLEGEDSRIDLLSVLVDCDLLRVPRAVVSSTGGN